jgi:hypothetical protein
MIMTALPDISSTPHLIRVFYKSSTLYLWPPTIGMPRQSMHIQMTLRRTSISFSGFLISPREFETDFSQEIFKDLSQDFFVLGSISGTCPSNVIDCTGSNAQPDDCGGGSGHPCPQGGRADQANRRGIRRQGNARAPAHRRRVHSGLEASPPRASYPGPRRRHAHLRTPPRLPRQVQGTGLYS